jgi:hypothetical protein
MKGHAIDALSNVVISVMERYYKSKAITSKDDFKHLCRATTHTVIKIEREHNPVGITVDATVERKIEKYIDLMFKKMPKDATGCHVYKRGAPGCPF